MLTAIKNGTKFISAFAGQIVFGTCNAEGYKNYKYFEISVFELHSFYLAIAEIIKNLSTDSELNKTMLCKKKDLKYFYYILHSQDTSDLLVYFSIENNTDKIYELCFNETHLNTFLFALVKIIPSTVCFNSTEFLLFSNASKQNVKDIITFQEEQRCTEFVLKFLTTTAAKKDNLFSTDNLSIFLNYYCKIILVQHNLKSLVDTISKVQNHFDNVASIIALQSKTQ